MKTKKDKQGVSLIVLVITIIVMIILAAAIVLTLNNSGVINRANEAVEKSDLAQVKHIATLKWAEAYLDETIEGEEEYKSYIEDGLRDSKINPDDYEITVTAQGVEVALKAKVPSAWSQNVTAIVDTVPIPKGFVASPYEGEKTKNGGLVIYELGEGETSIPADETQHTSWTTRNQYVWVPVAKKDFTTKFVRQSFGAEHTLSNVLGTEFWEVTLDLITNMPIAEQSSSYVSNSTLAEVQAMYASVKEYEGFYVARYEAGADNQRTSSNSRDDDGNVIFETNVYSMMGKKPYNCVSWAKNNNISEDTGGVAQISRSIYPATNTEYGVVSTLIYGVQWDTILQWWLDTNAVSDVTDSKNYGNYEDHIINSVNDLNEGAQVSIYNSSTWQFSSYVSKEDITYPKASGTRWMLSTGALKAANVNNIYDIAGNLGEWTMEGHSNYSHSTRGGDCFYGGAGKLVYRELAMSPADTGEGFGFRFALYIKK